MLTKIFGSDIFHETAGAGVPVIFVHGLGGTSNIWGGQRVALSKFFRVTTLDLPGTGRSSKLPESYSMARWAEQIMGLADHLGYERFVIVGHSMTTILAQMVAGRWPDRTLAAVLCGPMTELTPTGREAFQQRIAAVRQAGMLAVADQVVVGGLTAATRETATGLAGLWREVLLSNDPACYIAQCQALLEASATTDQPRIRCPVLLLVGDQDAVTPLANCVQIQQAVPHAHLRIIPSTAHMTMLERPEVFNTALLEFLASSAPA
jgi:pimeloyl-ACP methyl ester carboxylesterase